MVKNINKITLTLGLLFFFNPSLGIFCMESYDDLHPLKNRPSKDRFMFSMCGGSMTSPQFNTFFKGKEDTVAYIETSESLLFKNIEKAIKDNARLEKNVYLLTLKQIRMLKIILTQGAKDFSVIAKTNDLIDAFIAQNNDEDLVILQKNIDKLSIDIEESIKNDRAVWDHLYTPYILPIFTSHNCNIKSITPNNNSFIEKIKEFKFNNKDFLTQDELQKYQLSYLQKDTKLGKRALFRQSFSTDPQFIGYTLDLYPPLIEDLSYQKKTRLYTSYHSYNEDYFMGHSEFMRIDIEKESGGIAVTADVVNSEKNEKDGTTVKDIFKIFNDNAFKDRGIFLKSATYKGLGLQGATNFDCHVFSNALSHIAWTKGVEPEALKNHVLLYTTMKNLINGGVIVTQPHSLKPPSRTERLVDFFENITLKLGKSHQEQIDNNTLTRVSKTGYNIAHLSLSIVSKVFCFITDKRKKVSLCCKKRKKKDE